MSKEPKCKKCRRAGVKLFLKGSKCTGPNCTLVKKNYPPGEKSKRRNKVSEYGRELIEKQKLRNWYNLGERQFKGYVTEAMSKKNEGEDSGEVLIQNLENRLDNTVYRLGLGQSRPKARQMVNHGLIFVNGRKVDIPSYNLSEGDQISVNPKKIEKLVFENLTEKLKDHETPSWLFLDRKKLEGKVTGQPVAEEVEPPVKLTSIFEFYSR
jgi:small subunit ribosomal protein S4